MKKILLVDDHAPTRLMFSQILAQQDASYEIMEASNGREACETALEAKPDLILMDVLMPVMDGYEALASLKEDPETQAIRVLMLTALDLPFQQKLAYDLGAFGYVVKPVRLFDMNHIVKLALDSGLAAEELA
ncbi:MAG: response regulator [Chloroflexi bacterium]|nr:response regulator [Chloroflexota bacterium]